MAKAKHQKPKPNRQPKQPHSKKSGKQADISEFRAQLDGLGLKIIQVTADGNCFFRALADQLDGNEDEHEKYRNMVVQFIKNNREMFEPFVEDEVPFDEYCRSMGEDGTWAGHMELQATSLVTRSNICIHRHMSPRWYVQNFDKHEARMIHLSYHDGEHYNSVRSKDDSCSGPARPIFIKGDADLSAKSSKQVAATKSKQEGRDNAVHEESIRLVKVGSGCEDTGKVEQVLKEVGGDVDAAIEALIAEQGCVDETVADDEDSLSIKSSYGEDQDENSVQRMLKVEDETCKKDSSGNDTNRTYKKNSSQPDEKKISRTRPAHVVQRRNTNLVVVQLPGNPLQDFQSTKPLTMGRVGKTESKLEKLDQLLLVPFSLMECHLIWVHYASNRIFQTTAETDIRNRSDFCSYGGDTKGRKFQMQPFLAKN